MYAKLYWLLLLYLGGQPAPGLNLHGWFLTRPESGGDSCGSMRLEMRNSWSLEEEEAERRAGKQAGRRFWKRTPRRAVQTE